MSVENPHGAHRSSPHIPPPSPQGVGSTPVQITRMIAFIVTLEAKFPSAKTLLQGYATTLQTNSNPKQQYADVGPSSGWKRGPSDE